MAPGGLPSDTFIKAQSVTLLLFCLAEEKTNMEGGSQVDGAPKGGLCLTTTMLGKRSEVVEGQVQEWEKHSYCFGGQGHPFPLSKIVVPVRVLCVPQA